MVSLKSLIVVYGPILLSALVDSSPVVPRYFQKNHFSRRNTTAATIEVELGPQLSNGSLVFGSDNLLYTNATERWNDYFRPFVQVVVEPAVESDIAKIVKYCNDHSLEFLVRNRGHGATAALSTFSGVEINVNQLTGITLDREAQTVELQAGTYGGQVVQALWDEGYVTTTGSTACVGVMGPSLGGGHSRYEGLYGMAMDNILHFNIVLANGTELGVNATSHPDLMWALKGAGHNFAIVTSAVKEIYPKEIETWHYHSYTWTQDKLETVFETLNEYHKSDNGTTPPKMGVSWGSTIMNTAISTTEAVISWEFQYAGPADEAEEILKPFNAIGAVIEDQGDITYPEAMGPVDAAICGSADRVVTSAMTLVYNATAERALYNLFIDKVAQFPEIAPSAYLWHEGYSTAGLQAIPSDSTAYPHREENHLMVFFSSVPEGSDLRAEAETWARESVEIWNAGQPDRLPKAYVNYAEARDETLEAIYGYEPWRLDRLRSLKAAYDPQNRFRFFVPIIPDSA